MSATQSATQARTSHGFKVEISADGTTYTEIGGIPDDGLTIPTETNDFHEFTHNSSPGGKQESIPKGTGKVGQLKFKLAANPNISVQATLNGYFDNRTKFWTKVTNPDGDLAFVVPGYVAERVFSLGNDPQMLDVTIQPSGALATGSTYGA